MKSALTISKVFINRGIDIGMPISPMKLQKILYFAYGWYWAYHDRKLFSDDIQAWDYGPVIESVYHKYKYYGPTPILDRERIGFTERISSNDLEFLDHMWDLYKNYSATQLANATHLEGTPWFNTKVKNPQRMGNIIDDSLIKRYFKGLIQQRR